MFRRGPMSLPKGGGVLSIVKPPFYISRRLFDCYHARERGYFRSLWRKICGDNA
jgi:hypothetical protein